MIMAFGLGMAALSYFGLTQDLLPWLTSKPAVVVDDSPAQLAEARQIASRSGNLGEAIALAQQIRPGSQAAAEAQTQINQWQQQWQAQQDLFQKAKAAFDAQQWYSARDLAYRLPRNPYWDRQADSLYLAAKRKIADIELAPPSPTVTTEPTPIETTEPTPTITITPSPDPTSAPSSNPSPSPSPSPLPTTTPPPSPSAGN
ncbi:MAG: hypothetical protein HC792_05525 [Acaryochloridaceae cyanobacterium CSU_5_19]|nr:hypothetical protein [Acaryochloridaceae cyanobacterium CSU_5_19]